jgi:hypothetical protein
MPTTVCAPSLHFSLTGTSRGRDPDKEVKPAHAADQPKPVLLSKRAGVGTMTACPLPVANQVLVLAHQFSSVLRFDGAMSCDAPISFPPCFRRKLLRLEGSVKVLLADDHLLLEV